MINKINLTVGQGQANSKEWEYGVKKSRKTFKKKLLKSILQGIFIIRFAIKYNQGEFLAINRLKCS